MRRRLLFAALLGLLAAPVDATACSIALTTGGTLALSADGMRLGSSESGGGAALVTILNLGLSQATITIGAPTLQAFPPGFNAGSTQVAVAYSGGGLLSGVTQGYTTSQSSFNVPALLSVGAIVSLDNRVTSSSGFVSGTYQTRTVVTCS